MTLNSPSLHSYLTFVACFIKLENDRTNKIDLSNTPVDAELFLRRKESNRLRNEPV